VRFRLVETGKSYAKPEKPIATNEAEATVNNGEVNIAPVIWETGNVNQIRSLLVLRQAELVLARSQLTGNAYYDWYTRNRIRDLEIKIAYLRRWLAEAIGRDNGDKS
jgi:hypothetical protein